MPSVRAVGASFGRSGRPAVARVLSASEELPIGIVRVPRGKREELSAPVRRGARESARPNRFSRRRRPLGGASGLLMSDRQKKSYWVGRDMRTRTGAESVVLSSQVGETVYATRYGSFRPDSVVVSGADRRRTRQRLSSAVDADGGCKKSAGAGSSRAELVEHVRPCLHERDALGPIDRAIVGAPHRVIRLMTERRLDHVGIEAALVEDRARARSETVRRHFLLGVAHAPQRGIEGVFGQPLLRRNDRWEYEFARLGHRPDFAQNGERLAREGNVVRPAHLRAFRRDAPNRLLEVDLRTPCAAHFAGAREGERAEFQRGLERRPSMYSSIDRSRPPSCRSSVIAARGFTFGGTSAPLSA